MIAFADEAEARLAELLDHERRAAELEAELAAARAPRREAAAAVAAPPGGRGRRRSAGAVQAPPGRAGHGQGAASRSRSAATTPGDDVRFLLAANPGAPTRRRWPRWRRAASWPGPCWPCASCCSTPSGPAPTAPHAGVRRGRRRHRRRGGAAPSAGRSPPWPRDHQVLVVTHLAQVAAFADAQVVVDQARRRRRHAPRHRRRGVDDDDRVVELSRMLVGHARTRAATRATPSRAARQPGRGGEPVRSGGRAAGRAAPAPSAPSSGTVRVGPPHQGPGQAARSPARSR